MNYGLSNAVDTIATTMDYNHPNARVLLDSIYGPLVVIGQYGLAIASKTSKYKKSKDEILELFDRHNLDGTYLLKTYPPKQIMHTLRLAILQEIQKERHKAASSCLHYMSNEDFIELRTRDEVREIFKAIKVDLEDYEFNLICERAEVAYKFKASKGTGTLTVESFRQAYNEYDNAKATGTTPSWWNKK